LRKMSSSFWEDKIIVITGASSGLGKQMTRLILKKGGNVFAISRSDEGLENLKKEFLEYKDKLYTFCADVSKKEECHNAMLDVYERFKKIDVLINNAGVGLADKIEKIKEDQLKIVFDVNFFGSFYMMQEAIPILIKQNQGIIVNICSLGVKRPVPNTGGYTASKAALSLISSVARIELSKSKIKVINVFPGSIETDFRKNALGEGYLQNQKRLSRISPELAARRILKGIERMKKEIYTSVGDYAFAKLSTLFPNVSDWLIKKAFDK